VLLQLRFGLSEETMRIIKLTISPIVNSEEEDIGWEEITYGSVTYLIKSILSKGKGVTNVKIHSLDDITKL